MVCTAVIYKEEEWYVAQSPETGTTSQGVTVEEAVENLKEATGLYLEEFPQKTVFHHTFDTHFAPVYGQLPVNGGCWSLRPSRAAESNKTRPSFFVFYLYSGYIYAIHRACQTIM